MSPETKEALLLQLQRISDDIENVSQQPHSTQVIETILRLRKEESMLMHQIIGVDPADKINLAQVQYIKDMSHELMLIARSNKFSMLEYILEMAFTESSEVLQGSRSARRIK